ncbi:glycoside hydrolase 43 family protein [Opitutaceae bacterium EW11]|nr:glycoside hydrolase 43 family protein [Opitutaceae bacterium EW11]
MSATFTNPVLPGFHPDPSICRVGDDYYLANSTFEWFPGILLSHSRDLVHWTHVGHALTRRSQLDLRAVVDSGGIWAPSLSYADGQFWLVYAVLRTTGMGRPFKDAHVHLVTAPSITGPWSEPVHLNSIGFDPSLFHDEDGRKWLVNMQWDFRKGRNRFAGIVLQELDPQSRTLVGPIHELLRKPILSEGPNLYRHGGYYYLMLAEGGTGWNHGIAMARSRALTGPYECDPEPAMLTTRDDLTHPLQKCGHGELVQTPAGEWWLAHLCSRPLAPERRCLLGRETALQRVVWSDDGWLRLAHGGHSPVLQPPLPAGILPSVPQTDEDGQSRDDFDRATLSASWQTLRVPAEESWLSLTQRPGWLRLVGRECPNSLWEQSLVAKRLQSFQATAETRLDFAPTRFTQMAGLVCWYDTRTHFFLRVTHDEQRGRVVGVSLSDDGNYDELPDGVLPVASWHSVYLRAEIDRSLLVFSASPDGSAWRQVGPALDASKLSDDYGYGLHFTGAMIGLAVYDLNGTRLAADFDYFTLRPTLG